MKHPISASATFLRRIVLGLTAGISVAPLVWMFALSLQSPGEMFDGYFHLLPVHGEMIRNYGQALHRVPLLRSVVNGCVVCAVVLLCQILTAAPCAYALARFRLRHERILFGIVILSILIPHQAIALPLYLLCWRFGLLDSYAALIIPNIVSPFAIFLLRQSFRAVPDDLLCAARMDGLSEWSILWRVMIPFSKETLGVFAAFSLISHWNELFWPLIAIRNSRLATPALSVVFFRSQETGTDVGPMMAAATMIALPLIVLFVLAQSKFSRVKGGTLEF